MIAPKCDDCPVAELAVECIARATGHARLCELARSRPDYRRLILNRSTGAPADPAPESSAPIVEREPGRLSDWNALRALVAECDYLGPPSECGCTPLRPCWLGKGRRRTDVSGYETDYTEVTLNECLACVKGD